MTNWVVFVMDKSAKCFVLITGRLLSAVSSEQAIRAFASLLSISWEEANTRFSAAPCVVRAGLSQDVAAKYQRVLQRLGIECMVLTQADEQLA